MIKTKIKKLVLVVLVIFNFNVFFTVAQEIKTTNNSEKKIAIKKIMGSWKKKKRQMIKEIYEQTNISSLMDLSQAANQLDEVTDKLKNLSVAYKTVKVQKASIDKKYKAVLQAARKLVIKLNQQSEQLKTYLLKIQALSKDLNNLKQQIKDIQNTIYVSKQWIKKYVAVLYKINNDYYNSLETLDNIKLLFKTNNVAKALSQEDIIKMLSLKTQELLDKLQKSEEIKKKFLRKLYLKRAEYVNLVNEYKTKIEILNSKRKFLIDLLTMLKTDKKRVDQLYDKLYKKKRNLRMQQIRIASSMKQALSWDEVKAKPIDLSAILSYTIKTDWDKFFNWPTRDFHSISAYFHDESYYKKFWFEHDGIDIKVPMGTPIYAPAAWYVYKVVDNDSDYYNYIVLVHNYGYVTIYGHISKALVKSWQIVKRGQIIWFSWGKKWTRWAWKLSTWPHLHFEVRKNGQLIDPLSVLDLSVYNNKNQVPFNWQIKYIKDKLTRRIDVSNVKKLPLNRDIVDRMKMFLKRYATKDFQNLTGWIQAWLKNGIDPTVAICIWYAESWLWHHLASPNNVWNIWNNDRWDRRGYPTPQAGINAIYYALNNKYLSKYYTIYSLSRYGNKDSHIYSSSPYNWYKNVIKCLVKIKWYDVDEYYPFRIPTLKEYKDYLTYIDKFKK